MKAVESVLVCKAPKEELNSSGVIFGGWTLAQMDRVGGRAAYIRGSGLCMTAAIEDVHFIAPILAGNRLNFYATVVGTGTTSMNVLVEGWVVDSEKVKKKKVITGTFIFVAVDKGGELRTIQPLDVRPIEHRREETDDEL